jgi:hypothetical protein
LRPDWCDTPTIVRIMPERDRAADDGDPHRNCSKSLEQVKGHAEQRVRTHLCKRPKIRSRWEGYIRYPNRLLYEKYGLFKVPTTAVWTRAHALKGA